MNVVDPSAVNCLVGILLLLLCSEQLLPGVIDNGAVVAKEFNSFIFDDFLSVSFDCWAPERSAFDLKSMASQ